MSNLLSVGDGVDGADDFLSAAAEAEAAAVIVRLGAEELLRMDAELLEGPDWKRIIGFCFLCYFFIRLSK